MPLSILLSVFHAAIEQLSSAPATISATAATGMAVAGITITSTAYQFGRWRERGSNRDQVILAEVARGREQEATRSAGQERRLKTIERMIGSVLHQLHSNHAADERWQGRVDANLESCHRRISLLEGNRLAVVQ